MHSTLFIFIDGLGIGEDNPNKNPFFRIHFKTFTEIFGVIPSLKNDRIEKNGYYLFPADATLGIEGLPQSGTGQTSLFCGVNASKIIGKHFGPYPYTELIPVLKEKNIFKAFLDKDLSAFFANAYPKIFFDYIKSGKKRLSATTMCCRLNGMRLNKAADVRKGNALTAEITNERWREKLGYKLPVIKPETAAKRLLKIASKHNFTMYEYFLTDHLGHGRYEGTLEATMKELDDFLFFILKNLDTSTTTLVICSDHGNIEDISVKTHTINPSLTIAAGLYANVIANKVKDLTDIKSAILEHYQ